MKRSFLNTRNEFLQFFPNCTGYSLYINPLLVKGMSDDVEIHSAIWKFFLVIAPNTPKQFAKEEDWIRILKEKRADFYELKKKHFIKAPDDDQNDPLLSSQNSEWNQFFKDQELRQQIKTDTSRAFQELEYFQKPENLEILEDILFLFCRTHPHYDYPQGLHELAAFILYTFHEEMRADGNDIISFIFNSKSVIPDAYFTFARLAELVEPLYRAPDATGANYIADISQEIQNIIIAKKSRTVTRALQNSGIAPHTYMMKWMRLLFLSAFDFKGVIVMWDILISQLSCRNNLDIVKNTCAAMLIDIEDKIKSDDPNETLHILFHYPSVSNPSKFTIEAYQMLQQSHESSNKTDLVTTVAERLNELSRGLNEICSVNGYELAMPYVMDLRRTRDILLGILPIEELIPLEMALELFKPTKIEYIEPIADEEISVSHHEKHDDDIEFLKASSSKAAPSNSNALFASTSPKYKTKGKQKSLKDISKDISKEKDSLFGHSEKSSNTGSSLFDTSSNNQQTHKSKIVIEKIKPTIHHTSADDLKTEDDPLLGPKRTSSNVDSDLFSNTSTTTKSTKNDILFSEEKKLFDNDPLFATSSSLSHKRDSKKHDGNLFGTSSTGKDINSLFVESELSNKTIKKAHPKEKKDLFGNDDYSSLSKSATTESKPRSNDSFKDSNKPKSIFADDEADIPIKKKSIPVLSQDKNSASLFADDDDIVPLKKKTTPPNPDKKSSLFDDDF